MLEFMRGMLIDRNTLLLYYRVIMRAFFGACGVKSGARAPLYMINI